MSFLGRSVLVRQRKSLLASASSSYLRPDASIRLISSCQNFFRDQRYLSGSLARPMSSSFELDADVALGDLVTEPIQLRGRPRGGGNDGREESRYTRVFGPPWCLQDGRSRGNP
ncbi:MAG: hypothetical protein A2050_00405 [Candidatus Rokubacteria bacterium GWA2_73_35]|nr:MAG: hypothetical protein A2050_00405 [Candidatus Rokubacteria bacterium GWA2_73_35]